MSPPQPLPFSQLDFENIENRQRLTLVIMKKLGKNSMTAYKNLNDSMKKKFNIAMNKYIIEMGINWVEQLKRDFDEIVLEEILDDEFTPEKHQPLEIGGCELLITEEQRIGLEEFEESLKQAQTQELPTN